MIHVASLTKYYHDMCAVDGISFDVARGEVMGLLGPNGAGKTTTLRMLTGFLQPTAGSIEVKDYRIEQHALEIRKLLGYLPEAAPLYADMLVYDYLVYVAHMRGLEGAKVLQRIEHLSELCGLAEVMHRPIGEISKGYKQRVGLAHAMMSDPEILILDEPTSGLDPNQIVEIREIIREIGRQKTVILSTHILSEAEATCDRIVIIHQGRIVADGAAEELKQKAHGEKVIHITLETDALAAVNDTLQAIDGVGVQDARENAGQVELKITTAPDRDLRGLIYQAIKAQDWILLEFHQQTQTLENIFRQLTQEN